MVPDEKHLSADQIAWLLEVARDSRGDGGKSTDSNSARLHLASCVECQRLLAMHKEWEGAFDRVRGHGPSEATASCPRDEDVIGVAGGAVAGPRSEDLLSHIATCSHCGHLFRVMHEAFAADVSAHDKTFIGKLASADPDWQRKLVARCFQISNFETPPEATSKSGFQDDVQYGLLNTRTPLRDRLTQRILRVTSVPSAIMWSAAIVLVVVLGVLLTVRSRAETDVDRMLADAYSEKRLIEPRIVGARYAPLREDRGDTDDDPQPLVDANSLIKKKLKADPNDPKWLHAKGQVYLLRLKYGDAIEFLQRALEREPNSTAIMTDLASAYYERAASNPDRKMDYGIAIDYLGRVLKQKPDDPIALYNRALAEGKLDLYEPAILDWQHYLRIDSASPWAEQARQNLQSVQKQVSTKRSSLAQPTARPSQLVTWSGGSIVEDEIDARIEDYQRTAIIEWLPQVFTVAKETGKNRDGMIALIDLAKVLRDRHDDSWLSELLSSSHHYPFGLAVDQLALSIEDNESGDYAAGRTAASKSRVLFETAHNPAGELRAEEEQLYSSHLLYDGQDCLSLERDLDRRLSRTTYRWLQSQVSLELANCEYLAGNLGAARMALDRGVKLATDFQYEDLRLRGLGFEAESTGDVGDPQSGFNLAVKGLDRFWSGRADVMKGYNFYTDLDTAADTLRLPDLQVTIWAQATALIDLHPDLVQRAMAHRWYGNSAFLAERTDVAEREFAIASALFQKAPKTDAASRGRMEAEIWLASLESREGKFETANERLDHVRDQLNAAPSFETELGFYTTKAELDVRRLDLLTAKSSIQSAIYLAEWALRSFPSKFERLQWSKQTDRTYRTLVLWELRRGDAEGAIELWEWYKGSDSRAPTNQSLSSPRIDSTTVPDARSAPDIEIPETVRLRRTELHDRTVISYVIFPDGIGIWLYDDRGIYFQWVRQPSHELEILVEQFRRLCATRDSDLTVLRALGRSLYDVLLSPMKDRIDPGRILVFELDGILSAIPMEVLVDRNGHYIGESSAVIISPGLYEALSAHSDSAVTEKSKVLIVSVPVVAIPNYAVLTDAENEVEDVAGHFRSYRWLRGQAATLDIIRRELRESAVFHFTGHAVAAAEMSGLLLAGTDSRTLRPPLIQATSFEPQDLKNLRLVVLAACDTWGGPYAETSGTEELTQSFLRARVSYVVAGRWHVDSEETADFMHEFYSDLVGGKSAPAALHYAQLHTAAKSSSIHPFYWAAFGVQGY